MQGYQKIMISPEEIVPVAKRMRAEGRALAMIHGYLAKEKKYNVSYEYEVGDNIESYTVETDGSLPSIEDIYDLAAQWPERELHELMGIEFEGLDTSERLFMPDSMLSGQGQILVTPMKELIKLAKEGEEA